MQVLSAGVYPDPERSEDLDTNLAPRPVSRDRERSRIPSSSKANGLVPSSGLNDPVQRHSSPLSQERQRLRRATKMLREDDDQASQKGTSLCNGSSQSWPPGQGVSSGSVRVPTAQF